MNAMDQQPWVNGPKVAIDTETTGVDVHHDRVVTATVLVIDGGNVEAHNWLTSPGVPIPESATQVHGVTDAHAAEHGRPPVEVLGEIAALLAKHWAAGTPLIAMNASYDLSLLDAELLRHRGERLALSGPVLDPYVIDKAVDPYRKGKRRLGDLCAHYGVQLDNAHSSHDDALAAARLMWRLAQRWPEIGTVDLATLHDRQVDWHDRQAQSLQDYLRRSKRIAGATPAEVEAVRVDRGWPVRGAA